MEVISEWVQPCVKHLHWSATTTLSGNGKVIWAKFKSFLEHVVNKHTALADPLFNKCFHGDDIQNRKWLTFGMYYVVHCIPTLWLTLNIKTCLKVMALFS